MSCHVSCSVQWLRSWRVRLMPCHVACSVQWLLVEALFDAMSCVMWHVSYHVMSFHVMSCHVLCSVQWLRSWRVTASRGCRSTRDRSVSSARQRPGILGRIAAVFPSLGDLIALMVGDAAPAAARLVEEEDVSRTWFARGAARISPVRSEYATVQSTARRGGEVQIEPCWGT